MKRYKCLIFLFIIWATLLSSCYEDKGNYDYDWVPDVCLKAKLRDTTIARGEVLKITPDLARIIVMDTVDINPEDYTYRWDAILSSKDVTQIGTERDLNDTIWLTIGKSYQVNYIVREKKTGIEWTNRFNLRIVQRLTGGYLFMTENEDKKVELEIYASDTKGNKVHEGGILARSGFPYNGGGANCVANVNISRKTFLWVATGEGTAYLALPNFSWNEKQMVRMIMVDQVPMNYTMKKIVQFNNEAVFYTTEQGNAHVHTGNNIIFADYAYVNKMKFKASPYIGGIARAAIMYNEDQHCFVLYAQGSYGMMAPVANCLDVAEDVAYAGSELYYMQDISGGKTIAVLKTAEGKFLKCLLTVGGTTAKRELIVEKEEELQGNISMIANADFKVVDWNYRKIYFTSGGKLYTYRDGSGIDDCREVTLFDKEGNPVDTDEIVAVMMINNGMTGGNYRKYIYVSTYSAENGGKVYVTEPDQTECRYLNVSEVIDVEGRVKSLCNWSN